MHRSHQFTGTIKNENYRNSPCLERFESRKFIIDSYHTIYGIIAKKPLHEATGLIGYREKRDAIGELLMKLIHLWDRFQTWAAPRSPKIDHDDLTFQFTPLWQRFSG